MATSFVELRKKRIDLLHRRGVWEELFVFLEQFFTSDESADPAKVCTVEACEEPKVPQETVRGIRSEVQGIITKIDADLAGLDASAVKESK